MQNRIWCVWRWKWWRINYQEVYTSQQGTNTGVPVLRNPCRAKVSFFKLWAVFKGFADPFGHFIIAMCIWVKSDCVNQGCINPVTGHDTYFPQFLISEIPYDQSPCRVWETAIRSDSILLSDARAAVSAGSICHLCRWFEKWPALCHLRLPFTQSAP